MVLHAYWQCRVSTCKHPGRSYRSHDAMWQHLCTHSNVQRSKYITYENEDSWPAVQYTYEDSDDEDDGQAGQEAHASPRSVTLASPRRSRSPKRKAGSSAGAPAFADAATALELAPVVRNMETLEFMELYKIMGDVMEAKVMRAEAIIRTQSNNKT